MESVCSFALRQLITLISSALCLAALVGSGLSTASGSTGWRDANLQLISGRGARMPNRNDGTNVPAFYQREPKLFASSHSTKASRVFEQQSPAQQTRQTDARELKQGDVIERELAGGEAHTYQIALTAGQYLKVVVEQKGIDVVVSAFGPDGQKLAEEDNHPAVGLESVILVAGSAGDYRLEVRSQNKNVTIGRYEVKIADLREATSKDEAQLTAQKAFEEANQLRDQGTADSRRLAISKYEEALKLWQAVGDRARAADTLNEIGVIYGNMGDPKKALTYYHQAVPLYQEAGDQINEATTMTNMGLCYWRLGESREALKYHDHALELRRTVGDRQGEAITFNAIGLIYSSSGQLQEALKYYDQALIIERIVDDRLMESTTLSNLGNAYLDLSELQKALESYYQGLSIKQAIGDRQGEGRTLHNIAIVYNLLGEEQTALSYLTQALAMQRAVGNRQGEAVTLDAIGVDLVRTGEIQKALESFSEALAISEAVGDRRQQAYVLNHYSEVYEQVGEPQKSLTYSKQALSLMRAVGDRNGEAFSLSDAGSSYASLNKWEEAREYFRQALQLSRETGNRVSEAQRLNEIAHVERQLGNLNEARAQIELAVNILESTRAKVISQQLRISFLASRKSFYEFYIDLLMQMHRQAPAAGHDAAALQTSERARARSLLEILTEARVDIRQDVDTVLLERERSLQQQLSVKSERLTRLLGGKHTEEQEAAARREVDALLADYQEIVAQIRTKSPRYAALTQPQPLELKQIQEQVLDEDTLLLEYALGEDRSYLWVVTANSITSYELPKREKIEAAARRAYEALTARNKTVRFETPERRRARIAEADVEYLTAAKTLSQMVLKPVTKQLERKRLLIVSEGALQYVPFVALPDPALSTHHSALNKYVTSNEYRPLIVEHEIISLPSASVLGELRKEPIARQSASKTVAVLADPVFQDDDPRVKRHDAKTSKRADAFPSKTQRLESELERSAREIGDFSFGRLPHTRQEAEAIFAFAQKGTSMKSLDFEASRTTATSADLSQYRIIHFATHGLLNSQHPELSGIVLSLVDRDGRAQDGFLRLYETYNMKLRADLVVLSACRTALGKEIKGEGLVGLTRGFMYAGAARVIASLWGIEDKTTAELMRKFYYEMLVKHQRPAAALRTAQLGIWRQKRLAPYYWAAFVLQGEWK